VKDASVGVKDMSIVEFSIVLLFSLKMGGFKVFFSSSLLIRI